MDDLSELSSYRPLKVPECSAVLNPTVKKSTLIEITEPARDSTAFSRSDAPIPSVPFVCVRSHSDELAPALSQKSGARGRGWKTLPHLFGLGLALATSVISAGSVSAKTQSLEPPLEVHQRWETHEIEVVLDDSLRPLGNEVNDLIQAAFDTWADTGAAIPTIRFVSGSGARASLEPDGKSTILLAPILFEGHESDLAITIGFSNPSNGEVSEADIVINAKHVFSSIAAAQTRQSGTLAGAESDPEHQQSCAGTLDARACGGVYDLQNVLTHEVGHFFGLGENYEDTRATMFSCTSACETHKRNLSSEDTDTLVELYASRTDRIDTGCAGVQMGGRPSQTHLSLITGWALLLLLGLYRRTRRTPQPNSTAPF